MSLESLAVYVHTPFCPSKCGYCDFNSYAMSGEIIQRTVDSTIAEIRRSPWRGAPAKTIFFGGGTPTFLSEEQLLGIFRAVLETHPPIEGAEITSEANPGTVDMPKFEAMRMAGFNRISLGVQSFQPGELVRLGRVHSESDVERAYRAARSAGFANINLDLMFALPGQSPRIWEENLSRALALTPEHLSLYCLTLEPNTAFYKEASRGELVLPGEEIQVQMYEDCLDILTGEGYAQYEISNYAKPGFECRHNLCYWRAEEYAGYGPGAVGTVDGVRRTNWKHPERYCEAVESGRPSAHEEEVLSGENRRMERLMLGLRMNEGVALPGLDLEEQRIASVEARGWLERTDERLRLTRAGRHYCSEATLMLI